MEYKGIPARDMIAKEGMAMRQASLRRGLQDLSVEEQVVLRRIYPESEIEAVESLSGDEVRALFPDGLPSSDVHVQTLYKFQGRLEPSDFRRTVQEAVSRTECLRTNYCRLGREVQKVILMQPKESPNIICQDLSQLEGDALDKTLQQIMEANMRQEIDLVHGAPFRLSAFRTGPSEYAVLAVTSQIVAGCFDFRKIFREMGDGVASEDVPFGSSSMTEKEDDEASYWDQLLENLPSVPALPYEKSRRAEYRQGFYRTGLPRNISLSLQKFASGNRDLLMGILESAWGLLLLETNKGSDTYFPLLLPSHGTGGFLRVLPIRFRKTPEISIEKTVASQLAQIGESMKCSRGPSQELSFNHLLSFYDFLHGERAYSAVEAFPEGNVVTQNVWAVQGIGLGIYFHANGDQFSMTMIYDESRFKPYGMELLAKRYAHILQQVLLDWKQPLSIFERENRGDEGAKPFLRNKESAASPPVHSLISQINFMEGIDLSALRRDILHPRIAACFMGDRIPKKEMEENCIFVLKGTVSRNIKLGNGLYNLLDLKKANSWVNETCLLPTRRSSLSVEVMSEDATLLYIPLEEMSRLMNNEPLIQRRMLLHAIDEMEKYQRLWAQM